jgi:hypothetical protein
VNRARIVFFGALKVVAEGVEKTIRRGLLIDFGDTQALQEAVNSGFGEFAAEDGEDAVAVVLDGKASRP